MITVKDKTMGVINVLCIWDCTNIWIKISEVLAFIVFDPFTELSITLCIVVNVIFMALDQVRDKYFISFFSIFFGKIVFMITLEYFIKL